MLTHAPLHRVRPTWQTQAPFTHAVTVGPPGQTLPHAPQLLRSVERFRHWLPQGLNPAEQTQAPPEQTFWKLQVLLQLPQLFRSVWRSLQTPLQ